MEKGLTVVHSNELVEASYSLNVDETRLILLASSKIDSRSKSNGTEIEITPSEFVDAFDIDTKSVYRKLKNAVKGIGRKPIQIPVKGTSKIKEYFWLSYNEYDNDDSGTSVKLKFNSELEPYLYDLKGNFTSIAFEQAARLNTSFSYRLYQWLIQAKNFKKNRKGGSIQLELNIDWMKSQSGLTGKYELWSKFKEKIIEPSVKSINAKTDISVIWSPVKKGRKVIAVQFNYVEEKALDPKPIRPRLVRRPKVLKGSHEEGIWMRTNLSLLLDYEKKLKAYDENEKMTLPDLRKMAQYASIFDKKS